MAYPLGACAARFSSCTTECLNAMAIDRCPARGSEPVESRTESLPAAALSLRLLHWHAAWRLAVVSRSMQLPMTGTVTTHVHSPGFHGRYLPGLVIITHRRNSFQTHTCASPRESERWPGCFTQRWPFPYFCRLGLFATRTRMRATISTTTAILRTRVRWEWPT